jgi:hypothetical protein
LATNSGVGSNNSAIKSEKKSDAKKKETKFNAVVTNTANSKGSENSKGENKEKEKTNSSTSSTSETAITSSGQKNKAEKLASVDKLDFRMNFKYNITEIDPNSEAFMQYIENLVALYNQNGSLKLNVVSSASQVPTRAFKSNKELSKVRADKGKEQLLTALKEKGIDLSKVTLENIKFFVGGPTYSIDYLMKKSEYEKHQFIKISAN